MQIRRLSFPREDSSSRVIKMHVSVPNPSEYAHGGPLVSFKDTFAFSLLAFGFSTTFMVPYLLFTT